MSAFQRLITRTFCLMAVGLFCSNNLGCLAETFEGKCIRILDGDTIEVLRNRQPVKVRLEGVDCPEKRQAFGKKAKEFTASLVFQQQVEVAWTKKDRYGRILGSVKLSNGCELNEEIVRQGYGWWYRQYSRNLRLGQLEAKARLEHLGLWNVDGAVAPWLFRKLDQQNRDLKGEQG
jgi:micrococcal nuclease